MLVYMCVHTYLFLYQTLPTTLAKVVNTNADFPDQVTLFNDSKLISEENRESYSAK